MCLKITPSWEKFKTKFLSRHHFNSFIESALKIIERQMNNICFIKPGPVEYFKAPTNLKLELAERLICLCVTNKSKREFAPAYLFLAGEQAFECPQEAHEAILNVLEDLGWIKKPN